MSNILSSEELNRVIAVFKQEVDSGYTCKDKKSKYAQDIDNHMDEWQWYNGRKCGFDWCTCYFDWCFISALGVDRARAVLNRPKNSMGAGVRYSREYLKSIGRVGDTPQVGCAVYFGDLPYPRHIGFVYRVTDSTIYTYEGNCYVSSGVSGVKAKSYRRNNSDILDYGYPVYAEIPQPTELDGYTVGHNYEVYADDLAVREGPSVTFKQITTIAKGKIITCDGLASDSAGNTWIAHKDGWSCAHQGNTRYIDTVHKNTGWVHRDGNWYYYDENGNMLRNEWKLYKGDWYYLGDLGAMVTGWQTIGGATYYFYPVEGHMASIEWIDGKFLDASGKQLYQKTAKWLHNDKGWWFQDEYGWYPKNRSLKINRVEYEFDDNGYMIDK